MERIEELVEGLRDRDHNRAYGCLKALLARSERDSGVYLYFSVFAEMLEDPNALVRNRAIALIAANAKWDEDNRLDEIIHRYLTHVMDPKPVTARQCIQSLPTIARYKPELKEDIVAALRRADPARYPDSMGPLVTKDMQNSLRDLERLPSL